MAYDVDLDLGAKIRGAELGAIDFGAERKYLYTPPFLPRGSIHSFTIFSVSFSTPTRQTIRIEKLGLGNSDWNRVFARARYPLSPPIFSRIDLVYNRCIIEIIVRHLAHHTIASMSSSGSTYIPWSKCEATVPEGIDVTMCFCGSLCKFMQSEVLGDDYGMKFFMCENYEYNPPKRYGKDRAKVTG